MRTHTQKAVILQCGDVCCSVCVCVCSDEAEGAVRGSAAGLQDYRITGITQQVLLFDLSKMLHINSHSHTRTLRSYLDFTCTVCDTQPSFLRKEAAGADDDDDDDVSRTIVETTNRLT